MKHEVSSPWSQQPATFLPFWSRWGQSTYHHYFSVRYILILFFYLFLRLPSGHLRVASGHLRVASGHFPSGFLTKTLYAPLLSRIRALCPARLILIDLVTRIIFGEEYKLWSYSLCFFIQSTFTPSILRQISSCAPRFGTPFACVLS
jgi:hypothetical protein